MSTNALKGPWLGLLVLALLLLYPLLGGADAALFRLTRTSVGAQLSTLFIFAILALGLHVVVGKVGTLHLGVAAFFGVGAYLTGILTVKAYPFQLGFLAALAVATLGAGLLGVVIGAPTLRLRGDYLALVTLGFGEVVRFAIRNLEEITAGTRGLSPVPPPWSPGEAPSWLRAPLSALGLGTDWAQDYRLFYYLTLGLLVLVVVLLRNLERSPLGRAWVAVREDELAASSLGLSPARLKLGAFAVGAALAGLAGCLYATRLTTTAGPDAYDFNRSVIMLCCVILGGLGSLRGALLGTALVLGFDNVLAPIVDAWLQQSGGHGNPLLSFKNWRMCLFGLALILIMRFRPEGLLPQRVSAKVEPASAPEELPLRPASVLDELKIRPTPAPSAASR
jgi:branched-chain amino acid transport system permease protein